ncbi:MAG: LysM peptidoglycan-binding domain-containing protein [Clostridiales bacterium]|nr:LysM peptidoglycan-binding domain-containing protein [Clostridiales bacterium]
MELYVVQFGDNVESIAERYGISIERLISDNGLINPYSLVVGQTIVILYPKTIHTVMPGDTLESIAESYGTSVMILIRNNPFLHDREFLYQDETIVIDYNTIRDIQINGYTNSFISQEILPRAFPYLTFLSVFNYQIVDSDNPIIITFGDDTNIISMAKQYSTIPLLMISALSQTGDINVENVYRFLLDSNLQDKLISNSLQIIRAKEYMGVNFFISNITEYNQNLYLNLFAKISETLRNNGYFFMITMSHDYSISENLDYHSISLLVDRITFLQDTWAMQTQPAAPISDISLINPFFEDVTNKISPEYISIGIPLIGYDWVVPFTDGSRANLISLNSALSLAYEHRAVIRVDEVSQTPYFEYTRPLGEAIENHIVWFIDANTFKALDEVIIEHDLIGTGIWNIASYNQQLFSMANATYNISKLPVQ